MRLRLFERQVLHVVVEELHNSVQVAAGYRGVQQPPALRDLLRHRPRSISRVTGVAAFHAKRRFSSKRGYSDSPAASRASSRLKYSRPLLILPSRNREDDRVADVDLRVASLHSPEPANDGDDLVPRIDQLLELGPKASSNVSSHCR